MNVCFIPPVCELTVPESPSAVLALVPDPAGGTRTGPGGRVALAVHTRLVAFLRLGGAGKPAEQHGDGEQQRRCQHQRAPAAARARAGPPSRPVHSLTKDGCVEAQAPLLRAGRERGGGGQRLGELAGGRGGVRRGGGVVLPGLVFDVFAQGRVRWVPGSHLSVVLFPSAAPSRILTTRSDVTIPEMRPGGGGRALNYKIIFFLKKHFFFVKCDIVN